MSSKNQKWHSLGDFLKAKEDREKTEQAAPDQTPVTPVTDVPPVTTVTPVKGEAAPRRDFTRSANSIVRDAIPAGVFTGKCKHLYDYLYSQTRGAIVPVRSARLPTDRVMKGAGMTRHTYRAHIQRLIRFSLVEVEERPGEHGGNLYTVHLPEEVEAKNRAHTGDRGNRGDRGEKVPVVQGSLSDRGAPSLSSESSTTSDTPKTLIKTNTERRDDDDAALAGLNSMLKQAAEEVTGRELSPSERERWRELGEVLATELKIAAARTTVSSAPSFLAEHLRRRLWKKDKRELQAEAATATPQASKSGALTEEQIKSCPDCGGTGFRYKGENFSGGVEKCRHEKLMTSTNST